MASSSCDIDYQSIGKQCLDICQTSVTNGLMVKMSLSIGKVFSFNFCSETNGSLPLPAVFVRPKKKTKSPSTRQRDKTRLTAFRNKKAASPGLPVALDPSSLDYPGVSSSHLDSTLPSTSFHPRSSDSDANVPEDNFDLSVPPPASFDPSVPPPTSYNDSTNNICVCLTVPCLCLASKTLSPQRFVPKFKIRKTENSWTTNNSSSAPQLCGNCNQPFLDAKHICGDKSDNEDGDKDSECKNMNMNSLGVDILDRQACNDIVHSELHSDEEKHQILQTNCLSLLQAVPFNFELATFCFSHSKFFQLKKEDNTLGMRMQQIVNIFNDEFKKELSKHHV